MQTITLSHKSLASDIIITMDGNIGTSEQNGFITHFQDDLREDEIFDISYGWLEWQSGANIPNSEPNYSGHKYWTDGYSPEERRKFINKQVFHKE